VLGQEGPRLGCRTEEHLRYLDPVSAIVAREQSFCKGNENFYKCVRRRGPTELVSALERRRPVVDPAGKHLEQTDRDVAVLERDRFAEVPSGGVEASRVRAEMAVKGGQCT
jgi:hypothetical protein